MRGITFVDWYQFLLSHIHITSGLYSLHKANKLEAGQAN